MIRDRMLDIRSLGNKLNSPSPTPSKSKVNSLINEVELQQNRLATFGVRSHDFNNSGSLSHSDDQSVLTMSNEHPHQFHSEQSLYNDDSDDSEDEEDDEITVHNMLNILSKSASVVRTNEKLQSNNTKPLNQSQLIPNSKSLSKILHPQSSSHSLIPSHINTNTNTNNNNNSTNQNRSQSNSSPHPDDAAEAPSLSSPSSEDELSDMDEDESSSPIQGQGQKFSSLTINSPKTNKMSLGGGQGMGHQGSSSQANIMRNVPKNCSYSQCCICNYGPPPSFFTSAPTWADICYIGLYCLTISKPEIKYFHIKKDICTFIDAHYETICMRKRTSIWRQTVNMTLSHPQYFEMFQQESALENGRKGYYGLKQIHDPYEHTALNKRSRRKRRHEQKLIQEEMKRNGQYSSLLLNSPTPQTPISAIISATTSPIQNQSQNTTPSHPPQQMSSPTSSNLHHSNNNNNNNSSNSQKSPFLRIDIQQAPPSLLANTSSSNSNECSKKIKLNNDRSIILPLPTKSSSSSKGSFDDILNAHNSQNDDLDFHSFKYAKNILPKLEDEDDDTLQSNVFDSEREVPRLNSSGSRSTTPLNKLLLESKISNNNNNNNLICNSRSNSPFPHVQQQPPQQAPQQLQQLQQSPQTSRSSSPSNSSPNNNNSINNMSNVSLSNSGSGTCWSGVSGISLSSSGNNNNNNNNNLDDDMELDDDDDDDDDESPKKRMRKTTRPEEKSMLEKYYQIHYCSNAKHCKEELQILSQTLGWKVNRIQRWLDNRRTKDKLKNLRSQDRNSSTLYNSNPNSSSSSSNLTSFSISSSPILPISSFPTSSSSSNPLVPNNSNSSTKTRQSPIHFSQPKQQQQFIISNHQQQSNNNGGFRNNLPVISSSNINSLLN
ncbi:putative homeobox transcription factor [Tieghemostelium lacteum]|uniref:Putative homeobox transcription factor n=1 Tax=Tieghemostelium lacteum TaxID=361077 RepID=A0A151ZAT3_TIELA|nr:putative homeobox transcription factor [Tieghemostelium lacteum]|eukprot:KYQ91045.1 putative homeobox transcription factor [Tieghemostelium lacteum]